MPWAATFFKKTLEGKGGKSEETWKFSHAFRNAGDQ
jgi:hypothetical protein